MNITDSAQFLSPTFYIDCDHKAIIKFAKENSSPRDTRIAQAIQLYKAVRDQFMYNLYEIDMSPNGMKASGVLSSGKGFCIQKATLLAAAARAAGIPSRLGFADVKNHLTSDRLKSEMKTDIFLYHGYTDLYLDDKWVKATPAFNLTLCKNFGVKPLEFNGKDDSIFHESNEEGVKHMEYLRYHGEFTELPYETILKVFKENYPTMLSGSRQSIRGDFALEDLSST